jgi:hypothetical protein
MANSTIGGQSAIPYVGALGQGTEPPATVGASSGLNDNRDLALGKAYGADRNGRL